MTQRNTVREKLELQMNQPFLMFIYINIYIKHVFVLATAYTQRYSSSHLF